MKPPQPAKKTLVDREPPLCDICLERYATRDEPYATHPMQIAQRWCDECLKLLRIRQR